VHLCCPKKNFGPIKPKKKTLFLNLDTFSFSFNQNYPNFKLPIYFHRLGNEKYKSKTSYRAKWLEQFDLHLFDEDQNLEVVVCGKITTHGKCIIDLRSLPRERTLGMWKVWA
jgi:hypothetical protein